MMTFGYGSPAVRSKFVFEIIVGIDSDQCWYSAQYDQGIIAMLRKGCGAAAVEG
jgi:hypothetical protein